MRRTFLMVASIGGLVGSLIQPVSAAGPATAPPSRSPMQREVAPEAKDVWETEKGQDIQRFMEAVKTGKMTQRDAINAYRMKWYGTTDEPKLPQAPPLVDLPR